MGKAKPKQTGFGKGKQKSLKPKDEWKVVGWLNRTQNENVLAVSDTDGDLVGYISTKSFARFIEGEIDGIPIKTPPSDSE